MNTGKVSAAIGFHSDKKTRGVLPLNEVIHGKTVPSILKEKHPKAKTANTNYITDVIEDTMPYHPSIFEQINAKTVRKSTLKTHARKPRYFRSRCVRMEKDIISLEPDIP